ncbi:MAG: PfkB family carbohydrate kinase, partial [Verrucomicrobiae bacterium]|nr:PfkB family carbohydrate kinase [Verrucomicrobiae bacterium]
VARVLGTIGESARLLTVAGGEQRRRFKRALAADGVSARIVPIRAETRVCQTLVSGNLATELVEEAALLCASEVRAVLRAFGEELERADWLVLTGSVPRSCGDDFYGRLTKMARARGVPVAVDAQGRLLMRAVAERPSLVKINRAELQAATGTSDPAELLHRGAEMVVITQGAKPVVVCTGTRKWTVRPPAVRAVNPIGSGDAMLAGLVAGLHRGWDLRAAVQLGVACGAANTLTETAGCVWKTDVRRLLRVVRRSGLRRPDQPGWFRG